MSGFKQSDYEDLAYILRNGTEPQIRAALSNNLNVILSALDRVASQECSYNFKEASAKAAIRALRGLEQTAIMLETWAPESFPEVNEQGQKHFARVMMESAAAAIRASWAAAIREVETVAGTET